MKLADYLAEKRLSPTQFARALGSPASTITRLLRGQRRPGIDLAARIEAATSGAVAASEWVGGQQALTPPQFADGGVEGGGGEAAAEHDASLHTSAEAVSAKTEGDFA